MYRLTMTLFFVFILFNQEQAASIHLSSSEEVQDPSLRSSSSLLDPWYNRLNNIEEREQEQYIDHLWKRFSADASPLRQRRRFGNTRYGRSLPDDWN